MRKTYLSFSIFLALMCTLLLLALAACVSPSMVTEPSSTTEPENGLTEPSITTEPLTDTAPVSDTQPLTSTETGGAAPESETTPSATGMITSTEVISLTPETEPVTGTEVLPPTGAIDAGQLSNLLAFGVWNQTGSQIGIVDDLILNLETGWIDYVVVNTSQYLESGSKLIPVPWEALFVTTATAESISQGGPQTDFVLRVDQSTFENAPEVDLTALPTLGNVSADWETQIGSYWQTKLGYVLASAFLETEVQVLGDVVKLPLQEILVDVETGTIQYLLLSASTETISPRLIPVPLSVIHWDGANAAFVLAVDMQTLQDVPNFLPGNAPNTEIDGWDTDIFSFWNEYLSTGVGSPAIHSTEIPSP